MPNVSLSIARNNAVSRESSMDSPPLKVSELVLLLKNEVEHNHGKIRVIGEISSFKEWRSGHCYFDIKDDQALMPAVMFRPHFQKVPFKVADGLQILCSGRMSVYPTNSKLQMIVEAMEPLGQGALALAFMELKERLSREGLFAVENKKSLPAFSQCVGIVTSSHGAVLRDMMRMIKSRMPKVDVLFTPVRVQGEGAAQEIARAIALLDDTRACDVIIVGRGGGSLEDLWAFNEEVVARAIFKATTPIISAVGHETDVVISDFVADVRAATPTHAANLAVFSLNDLENEMTAMLAKLKLHYESHVRRATLDLLEHKRRLLDPRVLLFRHWQRLDEHSKKLSDLGARMLRKPTADVDILKKRLAQNAPMRKLRLKKDALFACKEALHNLNPDKKLQRHNQTVSEISKQLDNAAITRMSNARQRYERAVTKLDALSPLRVLKRGFSVAEDANSGAILVSAKQFINEQRITIRLHDGEVRAQVLE